MNPFTKKPEDVKPAEPVTTIKPEAIAPVASPVVAAKPDPIVILSEIDGYIHDRVKEQPSTLAEIKMATPEMQRTNDMLRLPKELEYLTKEYAFKWIYKKKQSIDRHLDILGYVLVTKIYFPNLPKRLFSSQGCVERGDAILGFVPIKRAEFLRSEPGRLSMERIKNLPMEKWKDGGEKYYKPALTEEKDGQEVAAGIQPDSRDFQET